MRWFGVPKAHGTERMNFFMRGIYSNDVFIESHVAAELSAALHEFVKAYTYEAYAAYQLDLSFFPMFPKLHAVHEIQHEMKRQSRIANYVFNVAAHSCSLDEDFIGRCAAVSRCTSPRLICKRTLERYLCQIQIAWARNWENEDWWAGRGKHVYGDNGVKRHVENHELVHDICM